MGKGIEFRTESGRLLATLVKANSNHTGVDFYTTPEEPIQVGRVGYQKGGIIPTHFHNPLPKAITGTAEVLLVVSGKMRVQVCGDGWNVATFDMEQGDFVILQPGSGHGFEMLEDTVLFECKSGPYMGKSKEKTFFTPKV